MGRRMTLDEFLKAFTDEETESVPDAISVRVSDAEVYSLGRPIHPVNGRSGPMFTTSAKKPPATSTCDT